MAAARDGPHSPSPLILGREDGRADTLRLSPRGHAVWCQIRLTITTAMHADSLLRITMGPGHSLFSADPGDVCAQNGLICAVSKLIGEELPAEPIGGDGRDLPSAGRLRSAIRAASVATSHLVPKTRGSAILW